ncbi:MAG: peptidoglycan DD-metalloendopeptidase family protein [Gemmatimonadales bacterium]|nr:peptidoglycan DD-metalloendopeptidase family protein [Gemmatimonadales bacterium]
MRFGKHYPSLLVTTTIALFVALPIIAGQQDGEKSDPLLNKIRQNKSELEILREEISSQQEQIVSLDQQAVQMRRSSGDILRDIELSRELLGGLDERERLLATQSEELTGDLDVSIRDFEVRRQALAKSLRSMYLRQQSPGLDMILMSSSFSEFTARLKWESILVRLGAGMMQKTRQEGERIRSEQRVLAVGMAEIALGREEAGLERSRLEMLEAEQIEALRNLENEKKGIKNRMLDLSLNEQRLSYILDDLGQQRTERAAQQQASAGALTAQAGKLEWPVSGSVIRGFGRSVHPRFKTVTLNNGLNIAASLGAPVAAVAEGKVEFADDLPGFGQCVILDHGQGYYTLYAYLDRVFVTSGSEIARGQVIAEVGRPLGGEQPQLYFEVRHGRTPLDPADWLQAR